MEVAQFHSSRTLQLTDFQKDYSTLKSEYSRLLLATIQEQDPAKQQTLIQQVLSINAELSGKVRTMILQVTQSNNTESLNKLTQELIQYQKEYDEIQKGKDSVATLKMIYANDSMKVQQAESMFYFYIFAIIAMCLIIVFLIFRTGLSQLSLPTFSSITGTTVTA